MRWRSHSLVGLREFSACRLPGASDGETEQDKQRSGSGMREGVDGTAAHRKGAADTAARARETLCMMDVFIAEEIVFRLCCGWCCMGVKGGKRPETEFPMGKVDVLRGASFVTDWRFSRLNQLSALGFGRRARLRFMSKKWEWVKTGLRGNRKRTRRGKSYVLRLNRFLV